MFGTWNPLLVAACLGGGLVLLLGVGTLLFQAGCALADVPDRGYFRSLLVYSAAVVLCLPPAALLVFFAGAYDADPTAWVGPVRGLGIAVSLVGAWLLSAVLYAFWLAAPFRKGLLIAGAELLLMGLLTALVAAVVLVVLSVVQIIVRPPPPARTAQVSFAALRAPRS